MLEKLLALLFSAKGSALATLLVVSTTGVVVSGTIDGQNVNLLLKPAISKNCLDALVAQTEALFHLDEIATDTRDQLRRMRDEARERASEQHKAIDRAALQKEYQNALDALATELTEAQRKILAEADLKPCQANDPEKTISVDVARLREAYAGIVRDFRQQKVKVVVDKAKAAFDLLVQNAQPKAKKAGASSGDSSD